jgi:hypothetical protein
VGNTFCARLTQLRHYLALDVAFKGASEPLCRLDRESEVPLLAQAVGHRHPAIARSDGYLTAGV